MGCANAKVEQRKLSASTASTASTAASLSGAVADLLGPTLLTRPVKKGAATTVPTQQVLGGKTIGLYFSAHWFPPCRGFTPQLAKAYTRDLQQVLGGKTIGLYFS